MTVVVEIAASLMERDGWKDENFRRLSPHGRERFVKQYLRKAKSALHDCHALGLIESSQNSGVLESCGS